MDEDCLRHEGAQLVELIYPESRFPQKLHKRAKKLEEEIVHLLPKVAAKLAAQIVARHERKTRTQLHQKIHTAAYEALLILFNLPDAKHHSWSSADRRKWAADRLVGGGAYMRPETFQKNYQDACIEALGYYLYELTE
jgi:hypothetical protein